MAKNPVHALHSIKSPLDTLMDHTDAALGIATFDPYVEQSYVKLPIPVVAKKMRDAFEVQTLEGTVTGKPGDFLVTGPHGESWPVAAHIFEATYQRLEGNR